MKLIAVTLMVGLCLPVATLARSLPSDVRVTPRLETETGWLPWWLVNGPVCMVNPGPLCVRK
jgi:hypothetical protein